MKKKNVYRVATKKKISEKTDKMPKKQRTKNENDWRGKLELTNTIETNKEKIEMLRFFN